MHKNMQKPFWGYVWWGGVYMQDYLLASFEHEFTRQSRKNNIFIDLTLHHDQAERTSAMTKIHNTEWVMCWKNMVFYAYTAE